MKQPLAYTIGFQVWFQLSFNRKQPKITDTLIDHAEKNMDFVFQVNNTEQFPTSTT